MHNLDSLDFYGDYEDEVRGFYSEMSDDEYEEMERCSEISQLERTALSLKGEAKVCDRILMRFSIDPYTEEIMFQSDTSIIDNETEKKLLLEFAENGQLFKTLQEVCDKKVFLDCLLDDVEERLNFLKEGDHHGY